MRRKKAMEGQLQKIEQMKANLEKSAMSVEEMAMMSEVAKGFQSINEVMKQYAQELYQNIKHKHKQT